MPSCTYRLTKAVAIAIIGIVAFSNGSFAQNVEKPTASEREYMKDAFEYLKAQSVFTENGTKVLVGFSVLTKKQADGFTRQSISAINADFKDGYLKLVVPKRFFTTDKEIRSSYRSSIAALEELLAFSNDRDRIHVKSINANFLHSFNRVFCKVSGSFWVIL